MSKSILIMMLLFWVLTGCNLYAESGASLQNQEEVLEQPTQVSVLLPSPTSMSEEVVVTPTATHTPQSPPVATLDAEPEQPCSPRTDWQTYTVVIGDTLYGIAQKTDSTIDELVAANCIPDASLLSVGQALYVPRLPQVQPTPTMSDNNPNDLLPIPTVPPNSQGMGRLGAAPHHGFYLDRLVLMDEETVHFDWEGYPALNQIEFVFYPADSPGNGYSMGFDTDFSDGISLDWQVPSGAVGRISASGRVGQAGEFYEAHLPFTTWSRIPDDEKAPPHTGTVVISPSVGYENDTYIFENNDILEVRLENPPYNCAAVEFFYQTTFLERENQLAYLGKASCSVANDPVISWHLPGGVEGYVYGVVTLFGVGASVETPQVNVYAEIYR